RSGYFYGVEFDEAVEALRALVGQEVVLLAGAHDENNRPYRGRLEWLAKASDETRACFQVQEPRDERWTNSEGVAFGVLRGSLIDARRCGGPGNLGLTLLQGSVRVSVSPLTPPLS